MKHTKKHKHTKQIRNVLLALGIVCVVSGLGRGGRADLTGQGALSIDQLPQATLEQGYELHASASSDAATSAGLLALGGLLFFLSFGFHAMIRLPNEKHVRVRPAPTYKRRTLHRKSRAREVIWIEKVIRL